MKKKYFLFIIIGSLFCHVSLAQILYSNSLGNLTLQSYTSGNVISQYTTVPNSFSVINDGFTNNPGALNNPNSPFHVPALNTTGWAVGYNSNLNDTFLVSTSWLSTSGITVDRWVITNTVTNISANTVLTWLAMSPDAAYPDGYEVYGTTKTGVLTSLDFTIGDRLFQLPDGNTQGGGEKSVWTRRSISLGAFAGQTLRFAFRNNSKNMFQLWIDDIEVKTLSNNLDAEAVSLETKKYFLINSPQTIKLSLINKGAVNISSVTVNYKYGTSPVNSQTFGFANGLAYLQTQTLTFGLPYSISSPGYYPVKSWISAVNGVTDPNTSNDTARFFVTVQSSSPQKNVLVEQFLSAKDGDSPESQQKLLGVQSGSVIAVNIHSSDSLNEINSSLITGAYLKSFSSAMIDRVYFNDLLTNTIKTPYYVSHIDSELKVITPASISIINKTYNIVTKQLAFTLKADFVGEVQGDYRINAYLTENNVYGNLADTTVNGYNQLSNYYNVPWSIYYQKGYFSPSENSWVLDALHYKHQNVLVYSFDGYFGNAGLIPLTGGTQGQSYQKTFTLSVPTTTNGIYKFNSDNLYIVGFVAEYNADKYQRNILNVVKEKITNNSEVVSIKENYNNAAVSIYPNPCNGVLFLNKLSLNKNYNLKIYNLLGKCIYERIIVNVNSTEKIYLSNISDGIYIIEISSDKENFRKKFIIQNK